MTKEATHSMSASSSVKARLSYLDHGARHIYHEAPSVASAMEAEYNQLTLDGGRVKPKDMQIRRREVCFACGNLYDLEQPDRDAPELENRPAIPLSSSAKRRLRAKNLRHASDADANSSGQSMSQRSTAVNEETLTCKRCLHKTHLKHRTTPTVVRSGQPSQVVGGYAPDRVQRSSNVPDLQQSTAAHPGSNTRLSTANRTSKRRAKARKQGGIQAILTRTKASQDATPDLDLMDFMQG